ncbi:MAG: hypothetical protein JWL75_574 [Parcubacteria group bacterium]|nr:hypothetical protein [Parcubacteria group bacterium]
MGMPPLPVHSLQSGATRYRLNNPEVSNQKLADKLGIKLNDATGQTRPPFCFYQGDYLVAIRASKEELMFINDLPFSDFGVALAEKHLGSLITE